MIYLFIIVLGFIFIRFIVALVNFINWPLLESRDCHSKPWVSILIPARNEGTNLKTTLQAILSQHYRHIEVIVLDDHSTDNTAEIVKEFIKRDTRFHLIAGQKLPNTWLGKNWACHQLAEHAQGEYLLFLDADVKIHLGLIESLLAEVEEKKLAMLSVFPRQRMESLGENAIVPLMHWILLSLLPLRLVYISPRPSFSAANGQVILFRKEDYRHHLWHERVKKEVTEDIKIMAAVKSNGLKGETLLSNNIVSCRMYTGLGEGIAGFSKNLLAGFGNSISGMLVFLALTQFSWLIFPFFVPLHLTLIAALMVGFIRVLISLQARENILLNLLFHPIQMVVFTVTCFVSIWKKITGTNSWKGRNISI